MQAGYKRGRGNVRYEQQKEEKRYRFIVIAPHSCLPVLCAGVLVPLVAFGTVVPHPRPRLSAPNTYIRAASCWSAGIEFQQQERRKSSGATVSTVRVEEGLGLLSGSRRLDRATRKSSDKSENGADLREATEERDAQAANLPAGRRHPLVRRRGRLSAMEGTHQGPAGYTVCGRRLRAQDYRGAALPHGAPVNDVRHQDLPPQHSLQHWRDLPQHSEEGVVSCLEPPGCLQGDPGSSRPPGGRQPSQLRCREHGQGRRHESVSLCGLFVQGGAGFQGVAAKLLPWEFVVIKRACSHP